MKKNLKLSVKGVAALMASTLLLGGAIGGTMAWLTADSGTVTNTFTIGDITLEIKEHKYDNTKEEVDESVEVTENEYKFVPGDTLQKDPYVIVKSGSEKCYIFVEVTENVPTGLPASFFTDIETENTWTKIENTNVYYFGTNGDCKVVDAASEDQTVAFMKSVKITDQVTKVQMSDLNENPTLSFKAFAVQSENLTEGMTVEQIWNLAKTGTTTDAGTGN